MLASGNVDDCGLVSLLLWARTENMGAKSLFEVWTATLEERSGQLKRSTIQFCKHKSHCRSDAPHADSSTPPRYGKWEGSNEAKCEFLRYIPLIRLSCVSFVLLHKSDWYTINTFRKLKTSINSYFIWIFIQRINFKWNGSYFHGKVVYIKLLYSLIFCCSDVMLLLFMEWNWDIHVLHCISPWISIM